MQGKSQVPRVFFAALILALGFAAATIMPTATPIPMPTVTPTPVPAHGVVLVKIVFESND